MEQRVETVSMEDYNEIADVWESSVRATHYFLTEAHIQFFKPLVLHAYLHGLDLRCVRDEQGRILGFSGVAGIKLEMLFVRPDARGQGIGKRLIHYVVESMGVHEVDVNEQNDQAVGFYKHVGFQVFHRSPMDAMGNPFPVLGMRLPVP